MNAQLIIDECQTSKFNPKQFRAEMNLSMFINDVVEEFKRQEAERTHDALSEEVKE